MPSHQQIVDNFTATFFVDSGNADREPDFTVPCNSQKMDLPRVRTGWGKAMQSGIERIVLLLCLYLPLAHRGGAQTTQSAAGPLESVKLVVVVSDENGAAVAGARVQVKSAQLPYPLHCETDFTGQCSFPVVPPCPCELRVAKAGFYASILPQVQPGPVPEIEVSLVRTVEVREVVRVRVSSATIVYSVEARNSLPFNLANDRLQMIPADPPGSFRLPAYFSLNLAVEKRVHLFGCYWAVRAGLNNITNHGNAAVANRILDAQHPVPTFSDLAGRAFEFSTTTLSGCRVAKGKRRSSQGYDSRLKCRLTRSVHNHTRADEAE
jgi:Carboxypeptidase regulatory-like domain